VRTMKIKLAGKPVTLTASFAASVRIAKEVADPLLIAREIVKEAIFSQQGLTYKPVWELTIDNMGQLMLIAMQATDPDLTEEEVQEAIFAEGYVNCQNIVLDYLAMVVEPKSQELIKQAAAAETKAKKPKRGAVKAPLVEKS
jgi:hypothetical protein